jgi:signal transduction histidine kinase/CheY-like chemotaxis protein
MRWTPNPLHNMKLALNSFQQSLKTVAIQPSFAHILCLMLGLLAFDATAANTPIKLIEHSNGLEVQRQTTFLKDDKGQLKYEDVIRNPIARQFVKPDEKGLNFGFTSAAYWYRLDIENPLDAIAKNWVIEIAWPPIDYLDFYVQRDNQLTETRHSGDQRAPGAAGIKHRNFSFPVAVKPGESITVYLRAQIDGSHQLPIKIWSQDGFFNVTASGNMALGMFYGIILVMLVYNLLIFAGARGAVYPYYLVFLVSIAGVLLSIDGFLYPILWALKPSMINGSLPMFVAMAVLSMLMFVRVSLQTRHYTPRLDKVLVVGAIICAAYVLLPIWKPGTAITFINSVLAAFMTVFATTVILVQALNGRRVARFYGVVWAALLIGIFTKVLQVNGLLPVNVFTVYSIHIGVCFLVTLLSLALVDQINTERREHERLEKEKAEAESSARNTILGRMSHELRTPMNAIIGFTDLALREKIDSKRRDHLRHIERASRSLLKLINDVLDFSRSEAGNLQMQPAPFALQPLLDQVISQIQVSASNKGLQVLHNYDKRLPPALLGDAARLEQILFCLMDNAIKFTEAGEVELSVQLKSQKNDMCIVTFMVMDTGIGLSDLEQANILTPLSQADESMTRRQSGIGIGLTLNRKLIELFGGKLSVQSESGHGSRFSFELTLPIAAMSLKDEDDAATTPGTNNLEDRVRGLQILLAEDNDLNQRLASEILNDMGVLLDIAKDGSEAVDAASTQSYDLILMDLQMPVMDGLTATRKIRELANCKTTPIIAMTANHSAQDRAAAHEAGMNGFLAKPLDIKHLMSVLDRWAPQKDTTLDEAEYNDRFKELMSCIELRDFHAQGLCEALSPTLTSRFGKAQVDELAAALQNFDFDHAIDLLNGLYAKNTQPTATSSPTE